MNKNLTILTSLLAMGSVSPVFAQTVVDGTITAATTIAEDANDQLDQDNADLGWFSYAANGPQFAWIPSASGAERTGINNSASRGIGQINSATTNPFASGSYTFELDYSSPGNGTLTYQIWTWDQISTSTTFGTGQQLNLLNGSTDPSDGANWDVEQLLTGTVDMVTTPSGSVAAAFSLASTLPSDGYWGIRIFTENVGAADAPTFNNVAITAVPEPSTFAFVGFLLLGALLMRRRK